MPEPVESTSTKVSRVIATVISGGLPKIDELAGGILHRTGEAFGEMVEDNSRWLDRNKAEALEANKKNPVAARRFWSTTRWPTRGAGM